MAAVHIRSGRPWHREELPPFSIVDAHKVRTMMLMIGPHSSRISGQGSSRAWSQPRGAEADHGSGQESQQLNDKIVEAHNICDS